MFVTKVFAEIYVVGSAHPTGVTGLNPSWWALPTLHFELDMAQLNNC